MHSRPNSAAAVAVATPCWPAPVSAMTRRLAHPLGEQRLAQHVVDLVRAGVVEVLALEQDPGAAGVRGEPRHLGERAGPAGVVAQQPVELGVERGVDPWPRRRRSARPARPSSASGTKRPPKRPKWPVASGQPGAPAGAFSGLRRARRRHAVRGPRAGAAAAAGVIGWSAAWPGGSRRHQLGDRLARVFGGHQALADQHRVGARGAYAIRSCGPRTPDSAILTMRDGQPRGDALEDRPVHLQGLQVAGVDADHLGAGVHRAVGLLLGVHLDQRPSSPATRSARAGRRARSAPARRRSAARGRRRRPGPPAPGTSVTMKSLRSTGMSTAGAHGVQVSSDRRTGAPRSAR